MPANSGELELSATASMLLMLLHIPPIMFLAAP